MAGRFAWALDGRYAKTGVKMVGSAETEAGAATEAMRHVHMATTAMARK